MYCHWKSFAVAIAFLLIAGKPYAQETKTGTAAPATQEATAETEATTIAIFPFQSRPKIDTRVAVAMVKRLTASLADTGKFNLLDRPAMAGLSNELEFTRKGRVKTESAAAWGGEHGVDYVVVGTVVAAGKGHGGMGIGGVRISHKAISLAVEIELIDCATKSALIEDTFKEEKTGLGLAVGTVEFDPESRRGSEMVGVVLQQVSRDILTSLHPPVVTEVDESGQNVTLNYGAGVFAVDDRWELFAPGSNDKIGAIQIKEVREGDATGALVDGAAKVNAIARFDKAGKKRE